MPRSTTRSPGSSAESPSLAGVAYSGEPGAFAEDAVVAAFGDVERVGVPGFRQVFEAVTSGAAGAGVVPIENSVHGTVRENYDLLLEYDLELRAEVVVPVRLCLAALPGEQLDGIERVYSHIQALGQAEAFLRTRSWALLTTYNTAGAGRLLVDRAERGAAAVLSPRAAGLCRAVGSSASWSSATIPRPAVARPTTMRTTLVLAVRNEPGALLRVLAVFAEHALNMSTIESRPSRERAWEYVFWVDLDADGAAPATLAALDDLAAVTTMIRVLGSYPRPSAG